MPADPPRYATDIDTSAPDDDFFELPPYDLFFGLSPPATSPAPTPIPTPRSSHTRKRPPTHIRRPRNAYIIFRSEFCERQKMSESGIESDHRQISRIAGHVWNNLPKEQKAVYQKQAEEEKAAHKAAHPEYRYSPMGRPSPPVKRKTKRETKEGVTRCRKLAEILLSGVEGEEFQKAARELDEGIVQVEVTARTSRSAPRRARRAKAGETPNETATPSPSVIIQDSPEASFGVVSPTPSPALSYAPYNVSDDDLDIILTPSTSGLPFPLEYEIGYSSLGLSLSMPTNSFMQDTTALPLTRSVSPGTSISTLQLSQLGEVSYSDDDILAEYLQLEI